MILLAAATLMAPVQALAQAAPGLAGPGQAVATTNYVIQPGDNLVKIARQHFIRPENWQEVQRLNQISDPRRLVVGSVIRIPENFFRTTRMQARVAAFQGGVILLRGTDRLTPLLNQSLNEGDVIETGANAFLRMVLSDGGGVSIPSNSRIRLDRMRAAPLTGAPDHVFTVLQGRMESRVTSVRNRGGYSVRTPVSVSAVRGTVFRNGFDIGSERAISEVLEGAVAVEAGGEAATVSPGFGAVMGATGLKVLPLPPAPYLNQADTPQSGDVIGFDITPVTGAASYRAFLAHDAAMSDIYAEADSLPGETQIIFPDQADGYHYVAISAVSPEGLEGPRSIYDFLRARNSLGDLIAEPVNDPATRASYLFNWSSKGSARPFYRFQLGRLARDGGVEDTPLIDREGLTEPSIQIPDLTPGTYVWRVRVTRMVQGQWVDNWSEPQTLSVRR